MRRIRLEKRVRHIERLWLDVLPLDPRDPGVLRAKAVARSLPREAPDSARSSGTARGVRR
jgi:hypothetical protein